MNDLESFVKDLDNKQFSDLVLLVEDRVTNQKQLEDFKRVLNLVGCWFISSIPDGTVSEEMLIGFKTFQIIDNFCETYPKQKIVVTLGSPVAVSKAFLSVFGTMQSSFISKIESITTLEEWNSDPFKKYFLENGGYEKRGKMFINNPDKGFSLKAFRSFYLQNS